MKILIVNDEELMNQLMAASLEELGYREICAETTGAGALKQLDAGFMPDVMFCDPKMPGMDGVELLRHLARRQFAGGIVLLSGEDWRIIKICEELGCAFGLVMLGYLQKTVCREDISRLLSRVRTQTSDVMIEIAESRLSRNLMLVQEILTRLRLKGFGLSLDDFGTGYSSLEQLHRMPFTELKIDRGFVHGAVTDSRSRAVFESSVDLARKLGMTTVAEGVENEDDLRLTQELGCELVQGYYFAKPMPAADLERWIATR